MAQDLAHSEEVIDWDGLTQDEAKKLLGAFDDWLDHNEEDDGDIAEYERLRKIATQESD